MSELSMRSFSTGSKHEPGPLQVGDQLPDSAWHMPDCATIEGQTPFSIAIPRSSLPAPPTNRREWWLAKLIGNTARDKIHQAALRKPGWRSIVVWVCQTEKPERLARLERIRNPVAAILRLCTRPIILPSPIWPE